MDRFDRQVMFSGFGHEGQAKLKQASVLVIGAGGLGCPTLLYLAAAGLGRICVVDGDVIALSNLSREVLYGEKDLGKNKAETAVRHFQEKYNDIQWKAIPEFITVENAQELIFHYDVVVDGSDNFSTHYLVNDACVLLKKPLVFGGIYQHEGQVSVFNLGLGSCNYRDLYPQLPAANEISEGTETGGLGVLLGIIGSLMALEVLKVLSGFGNPLANKVLYFNPLNSQSYEVDIQPNAGTTVPTSWSDFEQRNYDLALEGVSQLSWDEAMKLMGLEVAFVDVRETGELPPLVCSGLVKVPFSILSSQLDQFEDAEEIICFCQTGFRSQKAAQLLQEAYPDKKIVSIRGGIQALKS